MFFICNAVLGCMTSRTLQSLKEMEIISVDAYKVGEVLDVRYDPATWKVQGIKAKTEKGMSKALSVGSGRSLISIAPGDYTINDVMLMPQDISELDSVISVDSDNAPSLSFAENKKVVSKEGVVVGLVANVNIDTDLWSVLSISVKMDKGAFEPLGLKKGLLSKTIIIVRSEYIEAISDIITLNQSISDMKDEIVIE